MLGPRRWLTFGSRVGHGFRRLPALERLEVRNLLAADVFEPNDSVVSATNLGTGEQLHESLSIHTDTDQDWLGWTASQTGELTVHALFQQMDGNVELEVYDQGRVLIASSTSSTDNESVSVAVVAGQSYFIHVFGAGGDTNDQYDLVIDVHGNSASTPTDAQVPSTTSGFIAPVGDTDWFRFSAIAGSQYVLETHLPELGDTILSLIATDGVTTIAENDDSGGGLASQIQFTPTASGDYFAVVRGLGAQPFGYELSLATNRSPTISDVADQTIDRNGTTGAIPFVVDDPDTPASALLVSASSSNTALVPNGNLVLGGSGRDRTITVVPATDQSGTTTITLTVSDGELMASDTFVLSVSPPSLHLTVSPTTISEGGGPSAATGTVARQGNTDSALVVTLVSSDTTEAVVPATVSLLPGQTNVTFALSAVDDLLPDGKQSVIVRASAEGFGSASAQVTVFDDEPDTLEPNDTSDTATDLGSGDVLRTDLSITPGDEDWYEWNAEARGELAIDLFFESDHGDPELEVYDSQLQRVAWSQTTSDNEHVSLPVLAGERFLIRVFGADGGVHPDYELLARLQPAEPRVYVASDGVLSSFNLEGNDPSTINHPLFSTGEIGDVEVGPSGLVYVALDVGGQAGVDGEILAFTPRGMLTRRFELPDDPFDKGLPYPQGFDVLDDGTLLVAQPNSGRILRVFSDGRSVDETPPAGVTTPLDVAVTSFANVVWAEAAPEKGQTRVNPTRDGEYWVSTPDTNQSRLFDASGTQLSAVAVDASLLPWDSEQATNGSLWVVNRFTTGGGRLDRFDGALNPVVSIPISGTPTGLAISGNAWSTRVPLPDEDGDGLLDDWEQNGLDVNSDGVIDLDLPALGADPRRRDVFVEVDSMSGLRPSLLPEPVDVVVAAGLATGTVVDRVIEAFLDAPLQNPDGSTGIHLHVQLDENEIPVQTFANTWDQHDVLKNGQQPDFRDGHFGTLDQKASGNWSNIRAAKRVVYRYGLFADRFSDNRRAGIAETPGNDFIVALGGQNTPGGTQEQQAAAFMHELGHTLGLKHGGEDDINFKPNYLSVMNYHWLFPSTQNVGWQLDYSAEELPSLDEASLDETVGIGFAADAHETDQVQVGPLPFAPAPLVGAVDWDRDGQIDTDEPVSADINWGFADANGDGFVNDADKTPGELLKGHDDWSHLRYLFTDLQNFREFRDYVTPLGQEPDRSTDDLYDLEPRDRLEEDGGNDVAEDASELPYWDWLFDGLTVDVSTDIDWFRLTPASTGTMLIEMLVETVGAGLVVSAHDADLNTLDSSDGNSPVQQLRVEVQSGKTILIQVASPDQVPAVYDLRVDSPDLPGDLNQNGQVGVDDIDYLCNAIQQGSDDPQLDLNQDGSVGIGDLDHLVHVPLDTHYGDADVNGVFDSSDLVQVFQARTYDDGIPLNATWSQGDWNCDREFDSGDLVVAFQDGGYHPSARPRPVSRMWLAAAIGAMSTEDSLPEDSAKGIRIDRPRVTTAATTPSPMSGLLDPPIDSASTSRDGDCLPLVRPTPELRVTSLSESLDETLADECLQAVNSPPRQRGNQR